LLILLAGKGMAFVRQRHMLSRSHERRLLVLLVLLVLRTAGDLQ
jgi:hypothetical protein